MADTPVAGAALADDLIVQVLSTLTVSDIGCGAARVCTNWARAARSDALWRVLCTRDDSESALRASVGDGGWRAQYRDFVFLRFNEVDGDDDADAASRNARAVHLHIVGRQGVGKTAFKERFADDKYIPGHHGGHTVGIDFALKRVRFGGQSLRLVLWDSPGTMLLRQTRAIGSYLRRCNGVLLMFSVADRESFEWAVQEGMRLVMSHVHARVPVMLVGCKADHGGAARVVTAAEAQERAQTLSAAHAFDPSLAEKGRLQLDAPRVRYRECSAKTGQGVEQALVALTRVALTTLEPTPAMQHIISLRDESNSHRTKKNTKWSPGPKEKAGPVCCVQ
eukprot:g1915.t1